MKITVAGKASILTMENSGGLLINNISGSVHLIGEKIQSVLVGTSSSHFKFVKSKDFKVQISSDFGMNIITH